MSHRSIGPDDPNYSQMRRRLLVTWLKTLLGYGAMGALIFAAFAGFGYSYRFQLGFGLLRLQLPFPARLRPALVLGSCSELVVQRQNRYRHDQVHSC